MIAETKVVERDARSRSKRLAADSNVRAMAAVWSIEALTKG